MRSIVVAYDSERAIGKDNELPWKFGEMKSDMARFRELTLQRTVIMGRKTLESIGSALPHRRNIVVSRQPTLPYENIQIASSLEEAYLQADTQDAVIVGGAQLYEQALQDVEVIYATEVTHTLQGADAFFPSLDTSWSETQRISFNSDARNKFDYDFVTYEKK